MISKKLFVGISFSVLLNCSVHASYGLSEEEIDFMDQHHGTPSDLDLFRIKKLENILTQEGDIEWAKKIESIRLQDSGYLHHRQLPDSLLDVYRVYRDERSKELQEKIMPFIEATKYRLYLKFEELDFFDALYQEGVSLRKKGNFSEAKSCFEKSLPSDDRRTEIKSLHNLGSISYSLNQIDDSLHYFLQANQLHKDLYDADFAPSRNNINKIKVKLAKASSTNHNITLTYKAKRGYFNKLSLNIIRHEIAPYLKAKTLLGLNRFFYSLMTGLEKIGMRGVQHEISIQRPLSSWSHLALSRSLPAYEDLDIIPSSVWFNVLKEIDLTPLNFLYFQHLKNTNIHTVRFTTRGNSYHSSFDNGIDTRAFISNLPNQLISLHIKNFPASDYDYYIPGDKINQISLLSQLTTLRFLDVSENKLGDQGLSVLIPLIHLTALDVSGNGLSINGLQHLYHFKNLKALNISRNFHEDTPLGNQAIAVLDPLKNLKVLYAESLYIDDKVIDSLKKLKGLQIINFRHNGITNQVVPEFIKLKQNELKKLHALNVSMNDLIDWQEKDRLEQIYPDNAPMFSDFLDVKADKNPLFQ